MPLDYARIQETPLSLDALLADTERADCGALTLFSGTVRNHHQGRDVLHLKYTSHVPLAERMIREIEREVAARHGVAVCRAVHRIGALGIGESAIIAVVRAGHRAEAFAALRELVDAVKHRVPIWKEEFYADGSSAYVAGCCIGDAEPGADTVAAPAPQPVTARAAAAQRPHHDHHAGSCAGHGPTLPAATPAEPAVVEEHW